MAALLCSAGEAAENYVKLSAAQIRAAFIGLDFTDDVHWALQLFRDGSVRSFSMGRADTGRWRLNGDEFCVDYVKGEQECHEVWRSGTSFQLRREDGSVFLEGMLIKHQNRG